MANVGSKPRTAELARGRWPGILAHLGIAEEFLRDKHGPCPVCGGKDRFRFDDKDGSGSYYCSGCTPSAGDGFRLLMNFTGRDFVSVAREVEKLCHLPAVERRGEQTDAEKREWCRRVWGETEPAALDNPAGLYLFNRLHLTDAPKALRYHAGLWHKEDKGHHPAMVARIANPNGEVIGLHRTYLSMTGHKARLKETKLSYGWKRLEGGAVRLCAVAERMGIAEGIETALAAQKRFQVPCWAGVNAEGVRGWVPPEGCKAVVVFGDNDANYTGHSAAYDLAHRLALRGMAVEVRIPEKTGEDWADGL